MTNLTIFTSFLPSILLLQSWRQNRHCQKDAMDHFAILTHLGRSTQPLVGSNTDVGET